MDTPYVYVVNTTNLPFGIVAVCDTEHEAEAASSSYEEATHFRPGVVKMTREAYRQWIDRDIAALARIWQAQEAAQ